MHWLRSKLPVSTTLARIAVVVVLSGGADAASQGGPGDIKMHAVRSKRIKNGEVGVLQSWTFTFLWP